MRITNLIYLLVVLPGLASPAQMEAQIRISSYIDAGKTNVSEGPYLKAAAFGAFQFNKISLNGGIQFDLISPGDNVFTGVSFQVTREFMVKEFRFETEGLFIVNFFSDLVNEYNWGILGNIERNHFNFKLGTEFRTFHITSEADKDYGIESDKNIHENWNIVYLLGYNLKPIDHRWNLGISITNLDHFIINQETNPMLYLRGKYNVTEPLTLYVESWYKSAGALNISANYFGFFIRTGLIWRLDSEK